MNSVIASTQKPFEGLTTEFQNLLEEPVETTLQVLPGQPVGDFLSLAGKIDIVCQIVLPSALDGKVRHGTGFLISNGLLLTNNHVLPDLATASLSKARFFYERGKEPVEVELNPDVQKKGFFFTSPTPDSTGAKPLTENQLDFTIVAINHHAKISKVYHQSLSIFETVNPIKDGNANIIQHPIDFEKKNSKTDEKTKKDLIGEKEPYKRIAFRDNTILEIDRKNFIVHYQTPTTPGSSGSPVMNDEARLFGLHRSRCTNHTNCNTAILMDAIAAEIRRKGLLDKIQRWSSPSSNYTKKIGFPMEENENFVGRKEELRVIKQTFSSCSRPIALVAETGQGGIGKTQLALQYAYSEKYDLVVWIHANTPETIRYSYREFAENIGIEFSEEEKKQEKDNLLVKKALKWLQTNDSWLIIFDNAESPLEISPYLPKVTSSDSENKGKRHILITSRFAIWGDRATVVPVQLFTKDQSLSLMKKILKEDERIFKEEPEMEQLVTLLGNLPLAVSHAAYYIRNAEISILRYINQLQEIPGLILDENEDLSPFRYENTVKATYVTSMNHTCELEQKKDKTGASFTKEILYICSFFNPNNIPKEILEKWFCKEKPSSATPFLFDKAIHLLGSYSLINVEKGNVAFHPLAQTIVRESILDEEKPKWFLKAAECLLESWTDETALDSLQSRNPFYWEDDKNKDLISHAESICQHSQNSRYGENFKEVVIILFKLGESFSYFGKEKKEISLKFFEKSLQLSRKISGNLNFLQAEIYHNLGLTEIRKGAFVIKDYFEKSLDFLNKEIPTHKASELKIKIFYRLGEYHKSCRKYEEARNCFLKTKVSCEETFGLESKEFVYALENLGDLYEKMGNFTQSEAYLTEALEICKKMHGIESKEVILTLEILANFYERINNFAQSEKQHKDALEICKKMFALQSESVVDTIDNFADFYERSSNFPLVVGYRKEALEIRKNIYGLESKEVAADLQRLAILCERNGELIQAEKLFKEALETWEKIYGLEDEVIIFALKELVSFYKRQGNVAQAEFYHKRILDTCKQVFGTEDKEFSYDFESFMLSDLIKAKQVYEQGLKNSEKNGRKKDIAAFSRKLANIAFEFESTPDAIEPIKKLKSSGTTISDVVDFYILLGRNAGFLGKYIESITFFLNAFEENQKITREDNVLSSRIYKGLGWHFGRLAKNGGIIEDFEELVSQIDILKINLKVLDNEHLGLIPVCDGSGWYTDENLNSYSESLPHLALRCNQKALAIDRKIYSESHPVIAKSYSLIGWAFGDLGNYSEALKYHQKALTMRIKFYTENHLDTARSYSHLGWNYEKLEKVSIALDCYKKALAIRELILCDDPEHSAIKEIKLNIKKLIESSKKK